MRTRKSFIPILILFSFTTAVKSAELKPSGFINDYTNTLAAQDREALESLVADIEKETSSEIAVAIINSLEGRSIEDYANEVFNKWGIGKKGKDNGVLILVSMSDRKMRIEVGYGLEPVLPDAVCGRIIRNIMAPRFREGNYYGGISEAIAAIRKSIKGEPPSSVSGSSDRMKILLFLAGWHAFLILFAFLLFGIVGIIAYLMIVASLVMIAIVSAGNIGSSALMGLLVFVPFMLVFFAGFLSPFIYTFLRWHLKKKYRNRWKSHIPEYLKRPMASYGSSGGFHGSGGGGGFGGGCSGGGGSSGGW